VLGKQNRQAKKFYWTKRFSEALIFGQNLVMLMIIITLIFLTIYVVVKMLPVKVLYFLM